MYHSSFGYLWVGTFLVPEIQQSVAHPLGEEVDVCLDVLEAGCAAEGNHQRAARHPTHRTLLATIHKNHLNYVSDEPLH